MAAYDIGVNIVYDIKNYMLKEVEKFKLLLDKLYK